MGNESGVGSRRRMLPLAVMAVLVASAIGTSVVVGRVVRDQERRLLDERAAEAGALLSTSFGTITATLPLLGAVTTAAPQLFDQLAQGAALAGGWTGSATSSGDGFVIGAAAGNGPKVGASLTGARAALAARAVTAPGLVSDVFEEGGKRRLAFAIATGPDRKAVMTQEFAFDPAALQRSTPDSPFSELEAVVYAGNRVDPDRLLFATASKLPMAGDVATEVIDVGSDKWLLQVKTKHPLVGGFADKSPGYVLGFGLLTALLITALVDMMSRRRVYALTLVDERTAELREALAAKELLEEGQRRAREAAEAANQSKSEFLSRMSHELRTPLNAVLGFAQLLEIEDLSEADHDSVKQIIKGGRHLLDLINEVLDITRIESGKFQLSTEPVLAGEVLADTIELTRPLAVQANIQLITGASAGTDQFVLADRQRLKQILLNLVSNAIKYNRPGGTVALSCETVDDNRLRIKVRDTGPGIRPEHLDLLFTPFERCGAEQTSIEGSGIGLALSRRLAEALGGTLDVETALGQGSTFWVELPIVEGPLERYERLNGHDVVAPKEPPARPMRKVLYIEDNISNLRLVERILERDGDVELVSAMQGQLGVELAREHQPMLILLDLHLPDISGDEVLRQLRDDPQTSGIPVVVLSADATSGQVRRLLSEGAHAYMTKPLDVAELRGLVDSMHLVP